MKHIRHKQSDCVGCDACAEIAPQYFKIDRDGMARLRHVSKQAHGADFTPAYPDDLPILKAAAESCAVQIIALE
mgnify:CR=1 FL=1